VPTLNVVHPWPADGPAAGPDDIVDVPHANASARARFARPGPFPIGALVWSRDVSPLRDVTTLAFTVDEHIGWLAPAEEVDPSDVVKQVSFLRAAEGYGQAEFRECYRPHVGVARRHMPSLWQYVQYDVTGVAGPDPAAVRAATGIVAVSVLWFRSSDDFLHRYFASPQDELEFRSHEDFLDLSGAFTFVAGCALAPSPAARP
jgi:hypothetical protein